MAVRYNSFCPMAFLVALCILRGAVFAEAVFAQSADEPRPALSNAVTASEAPSTTVSPPQHPPFPDLTIPRDADAKTLDELIARAKAARPHVPQEYQAMQTAIRDASKRLLTFLKGQETTPQYQQAELDAISSTVALMTYFGEDAKQKTLEQVHAFLKGRKTLSLADVNTGLMAATMLELQPNKTPARETYQLLNELLEDDEREEMQSLRINLQASIRRLELLGHNFELDEQSLDGKRLRIEDYAGKFIIVDFFATWCEPCLTEVPRIQKHYAKYKDKGLEVIGISLDDDVEALKAYLEGAKLPWPIVHDDAPEPLDRLQMKFGVSHLPTVLLLNKEGIVVSLEARGAELDRLVQMLFDAPTPAPAPPAAAEGSKDESKTNDATLLRGGNNSQDSPR